MAALGFAGEASAQRGRPLVSIGRIASEQKCALYELTAGTHREAGAATPYAAGYASETSWRSYLVRDCVNEFASIRTSLEAALAGSGKLAVTRGAGASYSVTGRISAVSEGGSAPPVQDPSGRGFAYSSSAMSVDMDVKVRDARGVTIFGGLIRKQLETGSNVSVAGFSASARQSGEALYTELQHQVALAVGRAVAFHIEPLRVTGGDGRDIQLNYGAPLLTLGMLVQVITPQGPVLYHVTGAGDQSATAERESDTASGQVQPGATATVIEAEDPAANARRFKRVELP